MNGVRYPLGALICWLAFARTLPPALRRGAEPALVALCASFGCQGMYLAMSAPTHLTGTLFGTITWYNVSVQMWIIAVIACQQVLLIHWLHEPEEARARARRRLALLVCVPLAMAVLFELSVLHGHPRNNFAHPREQPYFVAYQVVYLTAFAVGKAVVAKACWFYARLTEDVWLRRGLLTAAVGACLDLVYSLGRFADVFLVHRGWDPSTWADVTRTCLTLGMVLNTVGWTAPLWGPRVQAVQAWWADYRRFRKLRPLWYALYRAHPETSLQPAPRSDLFALWDLRFRLHRRVIEIRDGCLALGGQVSPGLAAAPGPDGSEEERAQWEAAHIAAALAAPPGQDGQDRQDGQDGQDGREEEEKGVGDAGFMPVMSPDNLDFSADVRWLVQVSQAFASSPAARPGATAQPPRDRPQP